MSRLNMLLRRALTPGLLRSACGGGHRALSTTVNTSGLIREARQEDYDAVMDITHDVYGGRDYLPCLFPTFVRDPHMHCYVYEMDGRVVGFEAAQVIDGGMTIVTRGARVREECQGHGVMKALRKYIVDKLASDHTIKCISMTTSNTTGLATKPSVLKTNKEIFRREVHVFPYEVRKMDLPEKDDFTASPVTQISSGQLCELFQKPDKSSYFFPHNRIIINTIPFRLMAENAEIIQLENPHIIWSQKLQEKKVPSEGLLSMTTWFSCKAGICVDLEFYGCSTSFPEVCNHVGRHLRHIQHLAKHGHIMVPHSHTLNRDVLLCAMSRHGLAPADSPFKIQYLFEEYLEGAEGKETGRATG